jgi:protein unc-45
MVEEGENPVQFKEQGNEAFKKGDWTESVKWYTKAIKAGDHHKELPVFYKNRAAAYLKEEEYEKAHRDCTKSLDLAPNDPKALYRRCQAFEALGRFEESYRDARGVLSSEPANKVIQVVLQRLHNIVQERARQNAQTSTKVEQMFKLAFDPTIEKDKRENAMRNIVVLAREVAGAEIMLKEGEYLINENKLKHLT